MSSNDNVFYGKVHTDNGVVAQGNERIYFSIWIPYRGWLKIGEDYYIDYLVARAEEICKYIGMKANVRYCDYMFLDGKVDYTMMKELERLYREKEERSLCRYLSKFLKINNNK